MSKFNRRGGQPITFGSTKLTNKNSKRQPINYQSKDEEEETEDSPKIMFLQPEILPVQLMIDLLLKLGAKPADVVDIDKDKLAAFFYKHLTPKPQRKYDDVHRVMKSLKKNRKKREKIVEEIDWNKLTDRSKESSNNLNNDRLKPAPSTYSNKFNFKQTTAKKEVNLDDIVIISRPRKNLDVISESGSGIVVKLPQSIKNVAEAKPLPPINLKRRVLKLTRRKTEDDIESPSKKICISESSLKRSSTEVEDNESFDTEGIKKKKITLSES